VKLSKDIWNSFATLLKSQLLAKFNPAALVPSDSVLASKLQLPHKGFYGTVLDSANEEIATAGFLEDGQNDLIGSSHKVIEALYIELQTKGISEQRVLTGSFNFTVVWDALFINNGIDWNENEDGVTFEWGNKYKGMYLPWEIKKMTISKVEIMNRICSYRSGVPSNLWRLPEGIVHRLLCDSFTL